MVRKTVVMKGPPTLLNIYKNFTHLRIDTGQVLFRNRFS